MTFTIKINSNLSNPRPLVFAVLMYAKQFQGVLDASIIEWDEEFDRIADEHKTVFDFFNNARNKNDLAQ